MLKFSNSRRLTSGIFCILFAIISISQFSCKKEKEDDKPIVSTLTVTISGTFQYNGTAHEPSGASVTVKAGETALSANTEYTLSYSANANAGTATVTATGIGRYEGSAGAGNFIIGKFPVAVKADDAEKSVFDAVDPPLTYTTTPPLFGDDKLSGALSSAAGADVGEYDITQGSLSGGENYEITAFTGAKFEIFVFRGDGTSAETAYEIGTAGQLAALAELVNAENLDYLGKYYKLTADIDLNVAPYNTGTGWMPIGRTMDNPFWGTFDGNNHTVSGLYINDNNLDNAGLFGRLEGLVQNLGVVNVNIKGGSLVGGVAGVVRGGRIINCYSTGTISGINGVGGVTGSISQYMGTGSNLSNCYSSSAVNGIEFVGGVAGSVSGSFFSGRSTVSNSYSTGAISGTSNVGGVVGNVTGDGGRVMMCYSTGAVSGTNFVGGVVGRVNVPFGTEGMVMICVALNPVVNGTSNVGRVAGSTHYESVYYQDISGNLAFSGMLVNGAPITEGIHANNSNGANITAAQAKTQATYSGTGENQLGWRFGNNDDNPWKMGVGAYGLPALYWQTVAPAAMPAHLQ